MKKCIHCGKENQDEALFCQYCSCEISTSQKQDTFKKCPFCAETIQKEAILCRYCRREFGSGSSREKSKGTSPRQEPVSNRDNYQWYRSPWLYALSFILFYPLFALLIFTDKKKSLQIKGFVALGLGGIFLLVITAVLALLGTGALTSILNIGATDFFFLQGTTTQQVASPTERPISTTQPVLPSTARSTPTFSNSTVYTQKDPDCLSWDEVSNLHVGKEVCVTGIVHRAFYSDTAFFITFGPDPADFYIISYEWEFPEVRNGVCVVVEGEVIIPAAGPVIQITYHDGLYHCD